ncbi:MAG TPA: isochorismatase family protein [Solirubrobacteraceae bacterium]|nr:isochorismatase family protein [Solirubrobacteraceae bacterium]
MSLLVRGRAALVVIDVQEGFRSYDCFMGVAGACAKLLAAARILDVPALVSEQYPKGLGHSAPELQLHDEPRIEKTVFSAARAEGFELGGATRLARPGTGAHSRDGWVAGGGQAIVCGIETHVCVSQTVHDLLADGVEVHVPADAVGSRHRLDHERGLERLERAGAVVTTVEAALFELLERAGTPEFKEVQKLIL